jgi:hypothetical protein
VSREHELDREPEDRLDALPDLRERGADPVGGGLESVAADDLQLAHGAMLDTRARFARITCARLIRNVIDPDAEFLYVPAE